ncbi:hypothetical protein KCU81_g4399, partial [Aureobasidium melanogenum]|uniref:Uncharacterized protein n=1 Tax=Aureobasidium melanogenum (strain CBS 110374) TaxID=1043003 RepID=A0A074WDJ3_AURM1
MNTFKTVLGASSLLLGLASAQSNDNNPSVDILSCSNLSCIDASSGSVCQANATLQTGVGIASRVLSIPGSNDPLSLTLVDGAPLGDLAGSGAWLTTQTLYAGVPANFNSSSQNDACALMLQYQAQTLPEDAAQAQNTTSCNGALNSSTRDVLTNIIDSFDYGTYGSGDNVLPRCNALTQHVNAQIRARQNVGPWLSAFLTASGGALTGTNANETVARPQSQGCQPVSPEQYSLHPVVSMNQFLFKSGPLLSGSNNDTEVGAGRTGVTPVITVVYGDEQDSEPNVQYVCMKTFAADGGKLPQNSLSEDETSGASSVLHSVGAVAIAALVGSVLVL